METSGNSVELTEVPPAMLVQVPSSMLMQGQDTTSSLLDEPQSSTVTEQVNIEPLILMPSPPAIVKRITSRKITQ